MFDDRIKITIFTDGSCSVQHPLKKGGFGVFLQSQNKEVHLRKGYWNTTTSRMEMMAVLSAIKMVDPNVLTNVHIISDSQFVVNSFKKGFLSKWRTSGWGGVKNAEIWKEILKEIEIRRKMVFGISWTNGHQKDLDDDVAFGNACADALADYKTQESYKQDKPLEGFSWFYHEGSDAIFIDKTDQHEEMNQMGDVLILGDCRYANKEELLNVLKGTALMDSYQRGQLDVHLEIEKI